MKDILVKILILERDKEKDQLREQKINLPIIKKYV